MDDRKPTEICDTCMYYNPDKCYGYCQFHHKPKNKNETCDKWYDWNEKPTDPIREAAKTICARFHSTSPNDIDFVYRLLRREVDRERERIYQAYTDYFRKYRFMNAIEFYSVWDDRIRQGGK